MKKHIHTALEKFTQTNAFIEGVSGSLAGHANSMMEISDQVKADLEIQKVETDSAHKELDRLNHALIAATTGAQQTMPSMLAISMHRVLN